jgi:Secretion system C-terminal sorting domain
MKSKILFSIVFLLVLIGLYSPASYSAQSFNMWLENDVISTTTNPGDTWAFDVYIQNTGDPLTVYAFQFGWSIVASASNGGTLTGAWSAVNPLITAAGESPKNPGFATPGYIKGGWNIASGGTGTGVVIPSTPFKIATFTIYNTVSFSGSLGLTWYFGVPTGGLVTVITATDGTHAYAVTSLGNYSYNFTNGLPVELTSFVSNVVGRQVNLSWETKTEVNSSKYEIERALAGTKDATATWSSVGIVQAAGNSNSPKKYSYTDKNLQAGKYQYRLKMIDNDGSYKLSGVVETEIALPKNFELSQNYPNPFNPTTKIDYQVPVDAKVILEVYNIAGQKVIELVNQQMSAGYYTVDFGASKLSSGVYIYRLAASDLATGNNFSSIKKMMLLK